jgi:hypothetical protein
VALLLILIIIGGGLIMPMIFTSESQRVEEREELANHHFIAALYELEFIYDRKENIGHFTYIPTAVTEEILHRWRGITEKYPAIAYPEEAIEKGDWLTVNNVFSDNHSYFNDVIIDMFNDAKSVSKSDVGSETANQSTLRRYILHGAAEGVFLDVLIDLEFEEPQNEKES